MKKMIATSLTLAVTGVAQSAVLLEKVVERTYSNAMSSAENEHSVKKTCSIQDNKKMVIEYATGDLVSSVTYTIQIDKNLIAKKIAAAASEIQKNGENTDPIMNYISTDGMNSMLGNSQSALYVAYDKKTPVTLLNYKTDATGMTAEETYKANSETATNLKNFMDLTCENLPTISESASVR
ncbi:MAG: hypothetical protein PHC99_12660 [Methylococcales bacterium]|nr:hypothetical protein [Methylococcales bacterium]